MVQRFPGTPALTVDTIIRLGGREDRVVLIQRANAPRGLALPGGFVDVGETVAQAAVREAREETSLDVTLRLLLGVYSRPDRDPRGHTVSIVFVADAGGEPRAADDARSIVIADPNNLPESPVFDHRRILDDYLNFLRTGALPAPEL
ncbi:MAG: NUDIX hydrolase [Ectothiorhodospiraceae bacterium]|jgi:8-oxo-dGTP diphosphatase